MLHTNTLKGNATVKHVLTDGVKNHIFTLVTPNDLWPNDYYVRYMLGLIVIIVARFS